MKHIKETVTTYEPDNSLKKGYLLIFGEIFNEIKKNRWLTYQLFRREFFTLYKQSFAGILWAFIIPLFSVGTFIVLNRAGIFIIGDINVPYPLYAIFGMAFWQFFSTGLISSSNSLIRAGSMISKIKVSKKSLVFASTGQAIVSFLIQLILGAMLFIFYGYTPTLGIFLIPLTLIPIILFMLGLGFILSLLNSVLRDVGNALSIFLTFLLFITPVLYERPTEGLLAQITKYNPIYYLISVPRDMIFLGTISEWKGFLCSSILSVMTFIVCLFTFHLTETRIVEKL